MSTTPEYQFGARVTYRLGPNTYIGYAVDEFGDGQWEIALDLEEFKSRMREGDFEGAHHRTHVILPEEIISVKYKLASSKEGAETVKEFKATNGANVSRDGWGVTVELPDSEHGHIFLSTSRANTLREFFQAEDDENWGRWRSKIDPDWTAVPNPEYPNEAIFRHEDGLRGFIATRGVRSGAPILLRPLTQEYFEAHPIEPVNPWDDAKPGDVWEFTGVDGGPTYAASLREDGHWYWTDGTYLDDFESIESGRRVWSPAWQEAEDGGENS